MTRTDFRGVDAAEADWRRRAACCLWPMNAMRTHPTLQLEAVPEAGQALHEEGTKRLVSWSEGDQYGFHEGVDGDHEIHDLDDETEACVPCSADHNTLGRYDC